MDAGTGGSGEDVDVRGIALGVDEESVEEGTGGGLKFGLAQICEESDAARPGGRPVRRSRQESVVRFAESIGTASKSTVRTRRSGSSSVLVSQGSTLLTNASNAVSNISHKVTRRTQKFKSRAADNLRMTFQDVSVKEALKFVRAGSMLQRLARSTGCCWLFCRSVKSTSEAMRYRWDSDKQALVQQASDPNNEKEVIVAHLVEIQAVQARVVNVKEWTINRNRPSARNEEFTIKIGSETATFKAACRQHVKFWVTALQFRLLQHRRREHGGRQVMNFVRCKFRFADLNGDQRLELNEVLHLFKSMNCFQGEYHLAQIFKEFDQDGSGCLNEEEFVGLFQKMMLKHSLTPYFERYSVRDETVQERNMSWEQLRMFLEDVQGDKVGPPEVLAKRFHNSHNFKEPLLSEGGTGLTEFGFGAYMCSRENSIMRPERADLHQDMTLPLSYYWISCSHNTYLEDGQIAGTASVDQYLNVMGSGCRCVEIDCWDGRGGEPVVTHGHTMTTKISFEEVVCALRDHGFEHNPYPLILSLEMHCSDDQVAKIGQILDRTFGDMLLRHPFTHAGEPLTSPEKAKHKVIVKAKLHGKQSQGVDKIRTHLGSEANDDDGTASCPAVKGDLTNRTRGASMDDDDNFKPCAGIGRELGRRARTGSEESCEEGYVVASTDSDIKKSSTLGRFVGRYASTTTKHTSTTRRNAKTELVEQGVELYNSLIYIVASKMHSPEDVREPCNISSFKEQASLRLIKKYGPAMKLYHRHQMTRVYPPGSCVNSENFNPMVHWIHGVQLVALNYQTTDLGMILHEGMFREQNGGYGYVLKPPSALALEVGGSADPESTLLSGPTVLQFTLLSGHCLPKPKGEDYLDNINPLVVVSIHGGGQEGDVKRFQSAPVFANGFCPQWNDKFDFELHQDDVAIIAFEVYHQTVRGSVTDLVSTTTGGPRKLIAAAAYPVKVLRRGIRWVELWDTSRRHLPNCGLLVELSMVRHKADSSLHVGFLGSQSTGGTMQSDRVSLSATTERWLDHNYPSPRGPRSPLSLLQSESEVDSHLDSPQSSPGNSPAQSPRGGSSRGSSPAALIAASTVAGCNLSVAIPEEDRGQPRRQSSDSPMADAQASWPRLPSTPAQDRGGPSTGLFSSVKATEALDSGLPRPPREAPLFSSVKMKMDDDTLDETSAPVASSIFNCACCTVTPIKMQGAMSAYPPPAVFSEDEQSRWSL